MGGGGGGNDDYARQQAEQEARKRAGRDAVNLIFGVGDSEQAKGNASALNALYDKVRADAFGAGKRRLDESRGDAARRLRFELFANGLQGGSVDVDQNALLDRTYSNGVLDLGARADAAKADFKTNDENTRLGLLQSIDAGMDQSSAMSSALAQMRNNADRASASAAGTAVGNLFDDAGLLYTRSNAAQGRQQAQDYWNTTFAPRMRRRGGGYSGTVTSTG